MIGELILLLVGAALVNNVILSQFLGLCPFLGVSRRVETAAGMGAAVIFVITIASAVCSAIYLLILEPAHLTYLNTIAALVQLVEMILKKMMKSLYNALGIYLPLITTNCAVLGVALLNVQKYADYTGGKMMVFSIVNGLGTSAGFCIAIVLMAGIRERIENNDITSSFRGQPIVLVTAGLMAIAFCGFAGVI